MTGFVFQDAEVVRSFGGIVFQLQRGFEMKSRGRILLAEKCESKIHVRFIRLRMLCDDIRQQRNRLRGIALEKKNCSQIYLSFEIRRNVLQEFAEFTRR